MFYSTESQTTWTLSLRKDKNMTLQSNINVLILKAMEGRNKIAMEERKEELCVQDGSRSWWGNPQRELTQACGSSQTLDQELGSPHGTDLGPLHVGDTCVAWSIYEAPSSGIWTFWSPLPIVGCLARPWCSGEELSPARLCWLPTGRLTLSKEWMEVGRQEVGEGIGGEEGWGTVVDI